MEQERVVLRELAEQLTVEAGRVLIRARRFVVATGSVMLPCPCRAA